MTNRYWIKKTTLRGSILGFLGLLGLPALAGASSSLDLEDSSAAIPEVRTTAEGIGDKSYTLGLGALVRPVYYGSDDYEVELAPLVDVQYGRFFARVGEGIGVDLFKTDRLRIAASANWMQGYDKEDAPVGINGVDSELGARLFAVTHIKGAVASVAVTQAVTDSDRGLTASLSLGYPISVSDRLVVVPSLGAIWGNEKYTNGYFGIDALESEASGIAAYRPGSGVRDISFRCSAVYRITDRISTVGVIAVTQLQSDAANSPIVEEKTQLTALLGMTYTF